MGKAGQDTNNTFNTNWYRTENIRRINRRGIKEVNEVQQVGQINL